MELVTKIREFHEDNEAAGVVEVVLILLVIVTLIVVFRGQIQALLMDIFDKLQKNIRKIY